MLQATRTLSALSRYGPFGECHLRDGVAAGDGVRPSKQLQFARRLGEARSALHSMHIDCGSSGEVDVVRYLLQECDTRRLTRVNLRVAPDCTRGQMSLGLLQGESGTSRSHALDVDSGDTPHWEAAVTEVLRQFSEAILPSTARTLTGCLAQSCANLRHLVLARQVDNVPSLARIKSLTSLEAHFLEADDINFILAELPMLRHLAITGGNVPSLAAERIELESTSLEVIDLTNATKGLTFESIQCPSLRQIRCHEYGPYGNGLVVAFTPVPPDGPVTFFPPETMMSATSNYPKHELCVFGSLSSNLWHPHALLEIPAECTVTWAVGVDSLSATAATTLGVFGHRS